VCYLNGTRDRTTVYNHHLKMDPYLNHGKWQPSEKHAFEEAIAFFTSRNWQEISEYVGTRTAMQCKERFENKYLNPEKYRAWSREEDKRLLEACEMYDKQWSRIAANEFPTRTDHSCLFRYNRLMSWREQTKWFDSHPVQIQEFIMMLYGKKKLIDAEEDETEMQTSTGDVVPRQPKFVLSAMTLPNLVEILDERTFMIVEFVEKKREGVFDATLLMSIGVPMFHINRLIARHRKGELVLERKVGKRGRKKLDETQTQEAGAKTVRERLREKLAENGELNNQASDDQVVAAGGTQQKTTRKYTKKTTERKEKRLKLKKRKGEAGNTDTLEMLSDLDLTEFDLADFQEDNQNAGTMNIVDNMKMKIRKLRGKYKKRPKDENATAARASGDQTKNSKKNKTKSPKPPKVREPKKTKEPKKVKESKKPRETPTKENQLVLVNANLAAPTIVNLLPQTAGVKKQRKKKLKSKFY
jgi:hypothetical protein